MQVVNFSITLPDEKHPSTQVHISGPGPRVRKLTLVAPMQGLPEAANQPQADVAAKETAAAEAHRVRDGYMFGGYPGIY